jgi:RNA polymerase sigma factor (TIGR02999 family)
MTTRRTTQARATDATGGASVTDLLQAWSSGDEHAAAQVLPLIYEEIRRIAAREMRRERSEHTLQATEVAHEVFLRLAQEHGLEWDSRLRFFAFAAHLVRRILVDHARQRNRVKRGGRSCKVTLAEAAEEAVERPADLLALDDALSSLAALDPRKASVVELRFFGGLTLEEIADHLAVSRETVSREWRRARAWLYEELSDDEAQTSGP